MKTKISILLLGLGLVFTLGCTKYPPSSERLLEDLAVITQYDTKIDFNQYKTYTIASVIKKVTDKDTTDINNSDATNILNQIAKNMDARGFAQITGPAMPDLGIDVVYFENTYIYAYYGGYYGGYYPYWGYYYPYYPVYYSSYTSGMLNIQLVDLKNVDATNKLLYIRWNAYIRGLLTGTHTNAEILSTVDQAFAQTPQLVTSAK
jgi:hypothetical protein